MVTLSRLSNINMSPTSSHVSHGFALCLPSQNGPNAINISTFRYPNMKQKKADILTDSQYAYFCAHKFTHA